MARFETLAVIGVGLIGGSIGRTARARGVVDRVVGVGRNPKSLAEAVALGVVDEATTDLARGVAEADVVVVCTPVGQIAEYAVLAARHARESVLVTDAGSTKRTIVEAVELDPRGRAVFVGGHPIAGSERQGAAHATAELFEGRACVLTITPRTPTDRLDPARAFWSGLGCRLYETNPTAHDEALALTSHLPHAAAATLAATVPPEVLELAAGAYRDGTRVAGADAGLWTEIFRENRVPLLRALDQYEAALSQFRAALEADDGEALRVWWNAARARRAHYDPHPRKPRAGPPETH